IRTCAHVREHDPDLLARRTEATVSGRPDQNIRRATLARLFTFTALLVFGAVTLAWWGFLAWLFWRGVLGQAGGGHAGRPAGARLGSLSKLPLVLVVTGNFLHEHHDPAPQGGIINSHERSDQP